MVKTVSVYDKEKIKEISKPLATKSLVTSIIIAVIILALGVFMLVRAIINNEIFNIVVSGLMIVLSCYPIIKAVRQNKDALETSIKDLGVDKSEITISLVVREKRIEVTTEQNGEIKNSTVLIRNVSQIKTNANAIGIYVKDNMYYVLDTDYIEGNRKELLNIFKKAKIEIKGKE